MMRRRQYQKPAIRKVGGYWIGQYRDLDGIKRKTSLGPVKKVSKYEAEQKFAETLAPINARAGLPVAKDWQFGEFVRDVYLPWFGRKWKGSTLRTNEERIRLYLLPVLGERMIRSITDVELQALLDARAGDGFSHSVVAHMRWDLRQILRLAMSKGAAERNAAEELFVPSSAPRPETRRMTTDEVKLCLAVLDLREKVIAGLAVLAGLRPGEIFALKRSSVTLDGFVRIDQRVYRGELDSPKSHKSRRQAALGDPLSAWVREWLDRSPGSPNDWLLPSENLRTPLSRDNVWRRNLEPRFKTVGLGWCNFQVMRRTHASLLSDLNVDAQVRAEQMGHGVNVNQNQYTKSAQTRKLDAVNLLQTELGLVH